MCRWVNYKIAHVSQGSTSLADGGDYSITSAVSGVNTEGKLALKSLTLGTLTKQSDINCLLRFD